MITAKDLEINIRRKVIKKQIKSSRKVVKKKSKLRIKKKKKYKVLKKLSMDDIYRILNKIQLSRKESKFSVDHVEAATVEHVVRDLEMPFERTDLKTKVVFLVQPGEDKEDEEIDFDMDFFEDEQVEEGQLF